MGNLSVTHSADLAFQALADPTRRAVLDMLRSGERSVTEIADQFPVSRPAISKHLGVLRRAKLVREHRRGRHRVYELHPQPLRNVDKWLAHYRVFWQNKLTSLRDFVESQS